MGTRDSGKPELTRIRCEVWAGSEICESCWRRNIPTLFVMRRLANQPNPIGQDSIANEGIGGRGSPEKSMNARGFIPTILALVATALLFAVYLASLRDAIGLSIAST
jgi:hypothetical protein